MVRTTNVTKLKGGVSALTKAVCHLFADFARGLILASPDNQRHFLFARLKCLIADEAALKAMWGVKGASGTIPCLLCWNIVSERSGLHLTDDTNMLRPHSETDLNNIRHRSDEHFVQAAAHLSAKHGTTTKKEFETLEQSLGINYIPEGMLFDREVQLKPVSHTMFDWLHIYLVHGVFQVHVNLLLANLGSIGQHHGSVVAFLKSFTAPKEQASNFKGAVATFEKAKTKDSWKPAASEVLCIYPLLRLFVMASPLVDRYKIPFLVLLSILDMLSAHNRGQAIDATALLHLIRRHVALFKDTYGSENITPKFHYSIHLPGLLQRHGLLISCWCHERKHKSLKMFANNISNAGAWYEGSILRETTHSCLNAIANFQPKSIRLLSHRGLSRSLQQSIAQAFGTAEGIMCSKSCTIFGMDVHQSDCCVALFEQQPRVGQVHLHVEVPGLGCWSVINWWNSVGKNLFKPTDTTSWIETSFLGFSL